LAPGFGFIGGLDFFRSPFMFNTDFQQTQRRMRKSSSSSWGEGTHYLRAMVMVG
jgi:hypothetical protein